MYLDDVNISSIAREEILPPAASPKPVPFESTIATLIVIAVVSVFLGVKNKKF
ncbi:MAG: hypothetical protein WC974_08205 [Thermoplasmata archaeon]